MVREAWDPQQMGDVQRNSMSSQSSGQAERPSDLDCSRGPGRSNLSISTLHSLGSVQARVPTGHCQKVPPTENT